MAYTLGCTTLCATKVWGFTKTTITWSSRGQIGSFLAQVKALIKAYNLPQLAKQIGPF